MGGSAYPLDELRHAGVDLATPAPWTPPSRSSSASSTMPRPRWQNCSNIAVGDGVPDAQRGYGIRPYICRIRRGAFYMRSQHSGRHSFAIHYRPGRPGPVVSYSKSGRLSRRSAPIIIR